MENFWSLMQTMVIAGTAFWGLFFILLSMPQSKLRKIFLKIYSGTAYLMTGLIALYILNPIDLIPDLIPILGQVDDAGAIITAIFPGTAALIAGVQSRKPILA